MLNKTEAYAIRDGKGRVNRPLIHEQAFGKGKGT